MALALTVASAAQPALGFAILSGDPVDTNGRAYLILPGRPLILPGNGESVIVDDSKVGDVDLVVRVGHLVVGSEIPEPTVPPPTITDGLVPFTVIASDGAVSPPLGHPLPGPDLDGLPVVVFAFADLDGDGIIGPTNDDPDGAADNGRELQESHFPVGRSLALFVGGVAQGTVAIHKSAPASTGGLRIVLTAAAYIGSFSPGFMLGNVPDGPPVATMFPFIPDTDPNRAVEGRGRGGHADSETRISIALDPVIDPIVDDPVLGTPFAIPTDGSSATVDTAIVTGGEFSRARFVTPEGLGTVGLPIPVPLYPTAPGIVFENLTAIALPDDGPGNAVAARLIAADALGSATDAPGGTTVTALASPGLRIESPDTDNDPSQEVLSLSDASGIELQLEDAGGNNDSGTSGTITLLSGGFPTESLIVDLLPVPTTTSSTSTSTSSSSSTSTTTSSSGSTSSTSSTSTSSSSSTTSSTQDPTTTSTTEPGPTTSTTAPEPTTSTTTSTTETEPTTSSTTSTTTSTTETSSTTSSSSTSTSTSSSSSSTTSTTLAVGCALSSGLGSVACRIEALPDSLREGTPAGSLLRALVRKASRAQNSVLRAQRLVDHARPGAARRQLRRLDTQLGVLSGQLDSVRARAVIPAALRDELLARVAQLRLDVRTLRLGPLG